MKRISRLTDVLLQQHGSVILAIHVSLIVFSVVFAWLLRFDFTLRDRNILFGAIPFLLLCRIAAITRFNLLHGNWRYTGVHDAGEIVGSTLLGSLGFIVSYRFVLDVKQFPISVYVIELLLTGFFITAVRVGFRVLAEVAARVPSNAKRTQTLIIGAGFATHMIIRELQGTASSHWVVGCLDDNPKKLGTKILGKPVLGNVDELPRIVKERGIEEVLIAVPSATGQQMRRFVEICQYAGVKFCTVPSLKDLIAGRASIQQLRQVNLEDLLGRDPVQIDLESVRSVVEGRVVMVTGAAGSIGSELCRQVLKFSPSELLCLDQNETGLFYLEKELGNNNTCYCVGDYTNTSGMKNCFLAHSVQIVFHAAAYKHVPMMEENPREAIRNNVLGLKDFLHVAEQSGCEEFILISSDKAVNPSSLMGATKRIGELMMCSRASGAMKCVSVRFGNVLGSQGSVVPVFREQIEKEKRITVTHPDINRFFMTIPEAVSLVLQAAAVGQHGDVLVLDMGEPIRIADMAKTLIRLSGKTEKEISIVYTGLRPGEKLYEELFYDSELVCDTNHDKIKRTRGQTIGSAELNAQLEVLRRHIYTASEQELQFIVQAIVPEFRSSKEVFNGVPTGASKQVPVWPVSHELPLSASAQD
jgi:FlaA1/EpsC-like NDP-sugar epimerase